MTLEDYLRWLKAMPPSIYVQRRIDDIQWRMEGHDAPLCDWKKAFRVHPVDCRQCYRIRKRIAYSLRIARKHNPEASL